MTRLLLLVLGLGLVLGVAYYAVRDHAAADPGNVEGPHAPTEAKQTLDNVRKAAKGVEDGMKDRVRQDDAMQQAAGQ